MNRALGLVCLLISSGVANAQAGIAACDADPAISARLDQATMLADDPRLPFDARMAGFRSLLREYPSDPFVNRVYLSRFAGYSLAPLYDAQLSRYHEGATADERYLYAIAYQRRDPQRSAAILEALTRENPDAPWPHLSLAALYARAKDSRESVELERFTSLCPDTLDSLALKQLTANGNAEIKKALAARLRRQLPGRSTPAALDVWPILWQLEFQLHPAAEHDAVRAQIRKDVEGLRALVDARVDVRLNAIRQGELSINDRDGLDAVRAELFRVAPASRAAADAAIAQWQAQNPRPDRSASLNDQNAFHKKALRAAIAWVAQWPSYGPAYSYVYSGLIVDDLPNAELAADARKLWSFIDRNPDFTGGFSDAPVDAIADRLTTANVALDIVPAMVARARKIADARRDSNAHSASLPLSREEAVAGDLIQGWMVDRAEIVLKFRQGKTQAARAQLDAMRAQVNAASGTTFWGGVGKVVDAAIAMRSFEIARDTTVRMGAAEALEAADAKTSVEKRDHAMHEAMYWETRAKLAKAESRSADAVMFYVRAADATPRNFSPAGRSRFLGLAEDCWRSLGGTADGWAAYRTENAAAASQWTASETKMPPFSLQDTAGRPVRLVDLAGKRVFINVWATWCGPCQGELPWVQRLYDAVKNRSDIAVLTFNIDDDPGVIAHYMQEHKFTFPVVLAQSLVEKEMKVDVIPRNWILDPSGVLRFERSAGFDDTFVKDTIETLGRAASR